MIYFDNAATTFPKPPAVLAAVRATMEKICANPGRSGHDLSIACSRLVLHTRQKAADFLGIANSDNLIFCQNGTDALNMAIKGIVRPGMHVVTTQLEHNSVIRPLRTLERRGFIRLTVVAPGDDGVVRSDAMLAAIHRRTRLVIMTHASNVLGTLQPIAQVGDYCQKHGIVFMVDAAQSAGCAPIDVRAQHIDLLAMPGHKGLYGPQGTGLLYIAPHLALDTLREGGTGTSSELMYQPNEMPERFESGTLNTPGIAGLFCGLTYVEKNFESIRRHEAALTQRLMNNLASIAQVQVYGTHDIEKKVGVVAFNVGDRQSGEIADQLNEHGFALRGGLHCAPGVHQFLGTLAQGAVRASIGAFNTQREVDQLSEAVESIAKS